MSKRVNIIFGKEATIMSETPGGCEPEADENFTEEKSGKSVGAPCGVERLGSEGIRQVQLRGDEFADDG